MSACCRLLELIFLEIIILGIPVDTAERYPKVYGIINTINVSGNYHSRVS